MSREILLIHIYYPKNILNIFHDHILPSTIQLKRYLDLSKVCLITSLRPYTKSFQQLHFFFFFFSLLILTGLYKLSLKWLFVSSFGGPPIQTSRSYQNVSKAIDKIMKKTLIKIFVIPLCNVSFVFFFTEIKMVDASVTLLETFQSSVKKNWTQSSSQYKGLKIQLRKRSLRWASSPARSIKLKKQG